MIEKSLYDHTNHVFVILISVVATIGGFLFGFDSGVINGTVDGLQSAFNSDSVGTGFNVASMLLGCAAGAFFAGRLADLLVVDGDPSQDVTVLGDKSKIEKVFLNGVALDLPPLPERRPIPGWRVSAYSAGQLFWKDAMQ